MKIHPHYLKTAVCLLLAAALLPGCTGNTSPRAQSLKQHADPKTEQQLKQNLLVQDKTATDRLARRDALQHLNELALKYRTSPKSAQNYVQQLQKTHNHILAVYALGGKQATFKTESGKFKPTAAEQKELNSYIHFAKQALQKGKSYESPSFPKADPHYFVAARPDGQKGKGVIGVFSTGILKSVEAHQRKNLRLIPYPKEGKFNVESVHPDTMRDITVKTGSDNENASHYYENEVVVSFKQAPAEQELAQMSSDIGAEKPCQIVRNTYIFHSKDKSMKELSAYFKKKWDPLYVEPHYLYLTNETPAINPSEIPNDVLFSQYQWNLPITNTNEGWSLNKGSNDVVVAVVDTGVDLDHPDLQGRLLPGYNVVSPDDQPTDDVGHGTHVAGIIAANVNNGEGIAGMTWSTKILPVKALDSSGSGTTYSVAQGIIWAADHGAKVINLSLGNYAEAQFLHDAIKYAYDHDAVIIAATGNDNTERPGYPAAYPEVLSVSATDANQKRASFSNFGDYIDVMAPGESIASTYPGNQYAALSGTSMASPHVAALAALIRSTNPDLKNTEVMDIIRKNVKDLGDPGRDKYYGYGQIDVYSALQAAGNTDNSLQLWPQYVEEKLNRMLKRINGK